MMPLNVIRVKFQDILTFSKSQWRHTRPNREIYTTFELNGHFYQKEATSHEKIGILVFEQLFGTGTESGTRGLKGCGGCSSI